MNYRIVWSKWKDPLLPLLNIEKDFEDEEDFSDDLIHSKGSFLPQKNGFGPAVVGPMGVIPIHESNVPSFLFNFWVGNTNFRLTDDVAEIIDWTDGVESFDIFTPYRFRIAVGKLFDEDIVKSDLENRTLFYLKTQNNPTNPVDKIYTLKGLLNKQYKFWAIFVLENEKIDFVFGFNKEEVEAKINNYRATHKTIKNTILSWEK